MLFCFLNSDCVSYVIGKSWYDGMWLRFFFLPVVKVWQWGEREVGLALKVKLIFWDNPGCLLKWLCGCYIFFFFSGISSFTVLCGDSFVETRLFSPFFPSVYNELHQCKFMTDLLRSLVWFHELNRTYHFLSISSHFWSSNSSFKVQLGA